MKILVKSRRELQAAGRWDIDFHLPAEGIKAFPASLLKRVDEVAVITKDKRDPTREPESVFQYIDISSVDVSAGIIANPQEIEGAEAPSRARKVVRAFDIVVSTCRPTRGAIAVVPVALHNQIASTGFSIVRAKHDVNPFYLHFALRLPSTLEQFRKWSTGSSYPAILDSDVEKTLIPVPDAATQDEIAARLVEALQERAQSVMRANAAWSRTLDSITAALSGKDAQPPVDTSTTEADESVIYSLKEIQEILYELPPLRVAGKNGTEDLFEEEQSCRDDQCDQGYCA